MNKALRLGLAFAMTVAIAYALCTVVFWVWPQAAASFMNGLFHGLDFTKLQSRPAPFDFGSFIFALIGITAWAFAIGTLFGSVSARLADAR